MTVTYQRTTTHEITHLEVSVEIDEMQDVSFFEHPAAELNAADPDTRTTARADAIRLAQHGRSWGFVDVVVRSQPDDIVRAALGSVDSFATDVLRRNQRAAACAASHFAEITGELVAEARDNIVDQVSGDVEGVFALPVVDFMNAPVDGTSVSHMAATAVDWWAR